MLDFVVTVADYAALGEGFVTGYFCWPFVSRGDVLDELADGVYLVYFQAGDYVLGLLLLLLGLGCLCAYWISFLFVLFKICHDKFLPWLKFVQEHY